MPTPPANDPDLVRTTYGRVAARYAEAFLDELSNKPLDRALLGWFADDVRARGGGQVADLGTGSGQIARHLQERGLLVKGIDLSPEMVEEARKHHPRVELAVGDLLALDAADGAYAGLTAFYAIVHLTAEQLARAFGEARRVLAPGGAMLVSWHVGEETLRPEEFLGEPCGIGWNFFSSATVIGAAEGAGLVAEVRLERAPYESEHASVRGYLLARRPKV